MELFLIIFPGIWALVGVIFTAIGVGITSNRKRKEQRCTICTQGTVVDVARRVSYDENHHRSEAWYPVFSYYAGGRQIEQESRFGGGRPQFTVGQTVELYYDPDKVDRYYVAGETFPKLLGRIFETVP